MGFSRQEYWNGLPCLPLGDLPNSGIESASLMFPALAAVFFTTRATWEAHKWNVIIGKVLQPFSGIRTALTTFRTEEWYCKIILFSFTQNSQPKMSSDTISNIFAWKFMHFHLKIHFSQCRYLF